MSLNLPDPNKVVGDPNHTQDTNLIIEGINTLKSQVDGIPAGPQGPQGEPGTPGQNGLAATITVVNTVTSAPGSNAAVTSSGTPQNVGLTFTIPRGETGPQGPQGPQGAIGPEGQAGTAAAISIGSTTTGPPESNATVTNSGTTSNAVLNFTIPRGPTGESANLGSATPQNLGVASAGTSTSASRQDHVHTMPTASQVGADPVGSAAAAQSAAEGYADSLAANYDAVGSAAAVAGDLSAHEGETTNVHGILDTADLVYDSDSRLTDDRYPTSHATSHETGGDDELELAPNQITGTALTESELSDDPATELSDTAVAGTSGDVARADHVHDIMYDVPAGAVSFDTAPTGVSSAAGKVFWDTDFATLGITMSGPGAVTIPVGQKSGAEVKNKTGGTINKGKIVQFDGASGGNIEVAIAVNDGTVNPRLYFGVAAENIPDDDEGFVVETGYIRGLNTNAWAVGTLLYIGASGDLTNTAPAKPAFNVPIAAVAFQNSNAGVIYVRMNSGVSLNEVFDVAAGSPSTGDSLVYNSTGTKWENNRLPKIHYQTTQPSTGIASGDIWVDSDATA